MKFVNIKPSFYDGFKCIADKCTDNCCIGWEIDIDGETLRKYNSLETPFGAKIREKITVSEDGSNCFKLCDNDRFPFLNDENLCEIITNCGEGALCDICTEHPRFYNEFAWAAESGLGLACEEVCRLLLEKGFSLIREERDEKTDVSLSSPQEEKEQLLYNKIDFFRSKINEKMAKNDVFCSKIDEIIAFLEDEIEEMSFLKTDKELISDYIKTEPIDESWTGYVNGMQEKFSEILSFEKTVAFTAEEHKIYSDLFCYILYRHLSKAVYDGEIMCRVCFAVESVRFIILSDLFTRLCKGEITEKDRINNIKRWSKQIEYSEENTEFLIFG